MNGLEGIKGFLSALDEMHPQAHWMMNTYSGAMDQIAKLSLELSLRLLIPRLPMVAR